MIGQNTSIQDRVVGARVYHVLQVVRDCDRLIREWVDARGVGAARILGQLAKDARHIEAFDAQHPNWKSQCGDMVADAAAARKAARRYALAAWVLWHMGSEEG